MTANRLVVVAVVLVALAAALDAVRGHVPERPQQLSARPTSLHIDLESATDEDVIARNRVFGAFEGVISKRAVARDGVIAIGVSHVPGDRPPAAAVEVWRAQRLVRTFHVPPGSFARGLWFTDTGLIATIGWNGRGWLWSRQGRRLQRDTYFAYETG